MKKNLSHATTQFFQKLYKSNEAIMVPAKVFGVPGDLKTDRDLRARLHR
jgi:hypothetical protein